MNLNFSLYNTVDDERAQVFGAMVPDDLKSLAESCGLVNVLWNPVVYGYTNPTELVQPLERGLFKLMSGTGISGSKSPSDYDALVNFVKSVLTACKKYPKASIETSVS